MALDEPNDNDETVTENGFTFVMEKQLKQAAGKVVVDMSYMGFTVTSELDLGGGASSCGSCSTSCS